MRLVLPMGITALLVGCVGGDIDERKDALSDVDQDGHAAIVYGGDDCDDENAAINPSEDETPYDGIDNDCDEESVDDDLDGDGFGIETDCDDTDKDIHPGATEVCDTVDNNCNDEIDEAGSQGEETWYADSDNDGYGDPNNSIVSCEEPTSGYVSDSQDCNDGDSLANPDGTETCATAYDDNCDGETNEADSVECIDYYIDTDNDGYGISSSACLCEPDATYTALQDQDCNDADPDISPAGIEEIDDGLDGDCNGDNDAFELSLVDTRGAIDVIGPRLASSGDDFYLAWAAEQYTENANTMHDGIFVIELDSEDIAAGEQSFYSDGNTTNFITLSEKFDFLVTEDYLVFGTGGVNGQGLILQLDWIDRGNQNAFNFYEDQIPGTSTWDDIQVGYSPAGNMTLLACGLGTTGLSVRKGGFSAFLNPSSLFTQDLPWSYDVCEHADYKTPTLGGTTGPTSCDDPTTPTQEYCGYNYILGASDIDEYSLAIFDPITLGLYVYSTYTNGPLDLKDAENTRRGDPSMGGNYISATTYETSGKDRVAAQTANSVTGFFSSVPIEDLDADITAADKALICGVGSNGGLFLFYSDVDNGETFTEIELAENINFDECAVTVTDSDVLALSARSGDNIYIGYAAYP